MKFDRPVKQQRWRLFIGELVSFTIIFAALGVIIFALYRHTIFQNIDHSLQVQKSIILQQANGNSHANNNQRSGNPGPEAPFRTNILIYNAKGKIINELALGERNFEMLRHIKLDPTTRNKITDISVTTADNYTSTFRGMLVYVPKTPISSAYAGHYILILENVDSENIAIKSFGNVLILTIFIFLILAIAVSYLLSRRSMKPVIHAWQKQQQFSADAAHELRTPLTVIQNNFEYLLTKPNQKIIDESESISTGLSETHRMKQLTENLLTLSRSDANITQVNPEDTNVNQLFENMLHPYVDIANSEEKVLQSQLDFPGSAKFDPTLIKQLSIILLDNALKYTPAHGTITFSTKKVGNRLQIIVADTGEGIPDADKKKVFERFYRVDNSRTAKTGGTGLGLSIAQWIVNQHHGKIYVKDNHPHGSQFVVELPIK